MGINETNEITFLGHIIDNRFYGGSTTNKFATSNL